MSFEWGFVWSASRLSHVSWDFPSTHSQRDFCFMTNYTQSDCIYMRLEAVLILRKKKFWTKNRMADGPMKTIPKRPIDSIVNITDPIYWWEFLLPTNGVNLFINIIDKNRWSALQTPCVMDYQEITIVALGLDEEISIYWRTINKKTNSFDCVNTLSQLIDCRQSSPQTIN